MSLAGEKVWISVARKNIVDSVELAFQMGVVFLLYKYFVGYLGCLCAIFFIINLDSHLIEASCIFICKVWHLQPVFKFLQDLKS